MIENFIIFVLEDDYSVSLPGWIPGNEEYISRRNKIQQFSLYNPTLRL